MLLMFNVVGVFFFFLHKFIPWAGLDHLGAVCLTPLILMYLHQVITKRDRGEYSDSWVLGF